MESSIIIVVQPTKKLSEREAHFSMHGVPAQNYHIMTPAVGKDWARREKIWVVDLK